MPEEINNVIIFQGQHKCRIKEPPGTSSYSIPKIYIRDKGQNLTLYLLKTNENL
jgi:hypothetical protein